MKAWVAQYFDVGSEGFVSVVELTCPGIGCPPAETVVLIFRDDATFEARVHAALDEVTERDIADALRAPRRTNTPQG